MKRIKVFLAAVIAITMLLSSVGCGMLTNQKLKDADNIIVVNVYPNKPGLTVNSTTFDGVGAHSNNQWSGAGDMYAKPMYNVLKLSWERTFDDMGAFKPPRYGDYTWTSVDAENFYADIRLLKNINTKVLSYCNLKRSYCKTREW